MSKKGNSVFEDFLNVTANVVTGGIVGFEADEGGFKAGVTLEPGIELAKELTGANAAAEANKLARDQFEQAKADTLADKAQAEADSAADQLKASNLAGGVRRGTRRSGGNTSASTGSDTGSQQKDFLGL